VLDQRRILRDVLDHQNTQFRFYKPEWGAPSGRQVDLTTLITNPGAKTGYFQDLRMEGQGQGARP